MEKKCENCRYKVERDMPLYKECVSCKGMKHFEPKTDKTIEAIKNLGEAIKNFAKKPITNRQWLESLSDEELAKEMTMTNICYMCYFYIDGHCCKEDYNKDYCYQGVLDWLQAEHKE